MIYGKSDDERRAAGRRREHWHLWFAWCPVILDTGRMIWFERVQRKGTCTSRYNGIGSGWRYEYAENK